MSLAGAVLAISGAEAGPLGLLIVVLLGVATYLLMRSLNRQLKKVPPSFDRPDSPPDGSPGPPPAPPADEGPPVRPSRGRMLRPPHRRD